MERDFLGVGAKEAADGGRQESGGASSLQWPFSNKMAALQHLMAFKTVPEDQRPRRAPFDHVPSSGFQPMTARNTFEPGFRGAASVKEAPQRCFSLDRHYQFSMHGYQPQTGDARGASSLSAVSQPSIPVSMSSPFAKVHGPSNVPNFPVTSLKQQPYAVFASSNPTAVRSAIGGSVSRNVSKPSSSQLTIFYAGSVNVYDDVPLDKAQAVMLLASKSCGASSSAPPKQRPQNHVSSASPILKTAGVSVPNVIQTVPTPIQTQSTAISISAHIGAQSRSTCTSADDMVGAKSVGTLTPASSQHESPMITNAPTPALPRAVPQARKASLARFLEKRKERVTSVMPCPSGKKYPDGSATDFEGANISSKCSSTDLSLSNNHEESWCSVLPKNSSETRDSPSTKLDL